ncbi:MAG: hypothetical protein DRH15_07935 [Deltaproteobacteria bacterium]|nr:MAG: hypothetical protein DRH15_07935 [Deltaproteobacteria bacterium]
MSTKSYSEIADIILEDYSLTNKLLRLVNSAGLIYADKDSSGKVIAVVIPPYPLTLRSHGELF